MRRQSDPRSSDFSLCFGDVGGEAGRAGISALDLKEVTQKEAHKETLPTVQL